MSSDSHVISKKKRLKRFDINDKDTDISITKVEKRKKKRDKSSYANAEHPPDIDFIIQNAEKVCKTKNNDIDDSVMENTEMDVSNDSHAISKKKRRNKLEIHNKDPEISIAKEKRKKKHKSPYANVEHPPHNDSIIQNADKVCKTKNKVIDDSVKENTEMDVSSDSHAINKKKRRKKLEIHNKDPEITIAKEKRKKRHKKSPYANVEHPAHNASIIQNAEKVRKAKNKVFDDSVMKYIEMDIAEEDEDDDDEPRLRKRNTFRNMRKAAISKEMIFGTMSDIDSDDERELKSLDIVISWELPPLHGSLAKLTKAEQQAFEEDGVKIKKGQWTYKEEVILKNNWMNFRREYDIKNPLCLLGLMKGQRASRSNVRKFAQYLGQGLDHRTLVSIYQQARRLLNPYSYKGRLSEEEQKELFRYRELFGHKWETIGRLMGRTGGSLYTFLLANDGCFNSGLWDYEEDKKLIEAVTAVSGNDDLLKIHHRLQWKEIATIVGTRNGKVCRDRWIYVLSSIMCGYYEEAKWKVKHSIRLIERLNEFPYEDEADVPWEKLYKKFPCANCFQLKTRYGHLRQKVPQGYMKTFDEVVTWLTVNHLPILKDELERKKSQERLEQTKKTTELLNNC